MQPQILVYIIASVLICLIIMIKRYYDNLGIDIRSVIYNLCFIAICTIIIYLIIKLPTDKITANMTAWIVVIVLLMCACSSLTLSLTI